ncbi:MAG TPA: amidohydrolase family protein, partial [Candidatus Angelobacter sp.]|nr:amidohydrolase family protein [Candidatus Angelobacter sp.]
MKKSFSTARFVLLAMLAAAMLGLQAKAQDTPKAQPAAEKVTAIRAATMIDGLANQPRHNVLIVIKGNKIESVTEHGNPPAGAAVIDFPESVTVLPGLIDTHTHIFLQGEDPKVESYDDQLLKHPSSYRAARATVSVRRALEEGFTTLRDLETE